MNDPQLATLIGFLFVLLVIGFLIYLATGGEQKP